MTNPVSNNLVKEVYPTRPDWSRKHHFGYLAVIGGSRNYQGAPVLVALAALRAGADEAKLVVPTPAFQAAVRHPELMSWDTRTDYFTKVTEEVQAILDWSDALVIGNGLTQQPEVKQAAVQVLESYDKPMVVDADALHWLGDAEVKSRQVMVTPHGGEFKAMTGKKLEGMESRVRGAEELAQATGFTVLLKGHHDVIVGGGQTTINQTGTPFMTKGGTGDVLAGVCGALLARGVGPFKAACCAAYLNGKAGEKAGRKRGEGLLPMDLIEALPAAIKKP